MTKDRLHAENSAGYESPAGITADPLIFSVIDGSLAVLLVSRDQAPQRGLWALPGGFVGSGEDPADTALRKLEEKTGVDAAGAGVYLEQLRTYAGPGRDPRGWLPSVAYLALVPAGDLGDLGSAERGPRWWSVDDLPSELAFDHARIIADGVERLRGKLWYSNVAVGLLPPSFTLRQARLIYEAIAGREYNPGNFGRDLIATRLIEETGETVAGERGAPARAFRFRSSEPAWGHSATKRVAG